MSYEPITTALPFFAAVPTRAPFPVWRDSTMKEVKSKPVKKKEIIKGYYEAERLERETRKERPGKHGGVLGHDALAVFRAFAFGFLNFSTGRIDPSYATIAEKANISIRQVPRALVKLKEAGIISWVRRCCAEWEGGRLVLRQITNSYELFAPARWKRRCAVEAPPPEAGTWGNHPPLDALAGTAGDLTARITALEAEAKLEGKAAPDTPAAPPPPVQPFQDSYRPGSLNAALAKLGKVMRGD